MEEGGTDISRIRKPKRNRRRKWNKETLENRIRVSFVVGPKKMTHAVEVYLQDDTDWEGGRRGGRKGTTSEGG